MFKWPIEKAITANGAFYWGLLAAKLFLLAISKAFTLGLSLQTENDDVATLNEIPTEVKQSIDVALSLLL